jgi:peptidoglycan/LPS O-acetylase OafA/YrhL
VKGTFKISSLDGVRGVAVMLVVASHAGYRFASAALGVNAFFFLSGFLITTLLRREYGRTGTINLRNFYIRRALRIFPPMYLTLGAVTAMVVLGVLVSRAPTSSIVGQYLHLTNYLSITHQKVLPGTEMMWSLSVEEHFYLLFPFTFPWLASLPPRRAFTFLVGCCVVILGWRTYGVLSGTIETWWAYEATDTRMDSVLWGAAFALFCNPTDAAERSVLDRPWVSIVAAVVLVGSQGYQADWYTHTVRYTLQCLCFFPLFTLAIRRPNVLPFSLLNRQPLVWLGTISYGLYLYHHVVIEVLEQHTSLRKLPLLGVTLAISLPLCWLSYRFIEQPMGRLRTRFND